MIDENWGIIGHEWAIDMLRSRLERGRIGHAHLITGMPGVGRSTLALRLAQALNCTRLHRPCGLCRACVLTERGTHPDVRTIQPDPRTIKTQTIRDMQHDLTLQPLEARYKIVIIEEFQNATDNAADALLKTLEEPPTNARLILTADTVHSVRPTIVSRAQVISLRPVPATTIEEALIQRNQHEGAAMLAHLAAGRPGWAFQAAEDSSILEKRSEVQQAMLDALYADRTTRFAYVEGIYRADDLLDTLMMWQAWWRDVFLIAEGSGVHPVNADRRDEVEVVAHAVTRQQARDALHAVRETLRIISTTNVNKRLALEVLMLHMPHLEKGYS